MSRSVAVGIDVGSYQIKAVVTEAQNAKERLFPRVLGTGFAEARGLRHGYVVSAPEVIRSLKLAIRQAEKSSGQKIKTVYLSIGGIGLGSIVSIGSTMITRADSEITALDIEKVHEIAENDIPRPLMQNRKIIHSVPIQYKIDGVAALGYPEGMKGVRLDVKMLFITCLEHHVNDLIECAEAAGVRVEDVIASPVAAGLVSLTKIQKLAGCILANIGAETVSIIVYENNLPVSLDVFPIGSNDITNDIALGFKIAIEEAEGLKVGNFASSPYPRKKLEEIIGARLSDIFELIESHLKKIGRNGLLPAGIILTGGGARISDIEDFAKISLRLPSKIAIVQNPAQKPTVQDSTWTVAYGLTVIGHTGSAEESIGIKPENNIKEKIIRWLKQFLP
ncbi:MAG: cell division protein FtsA [Candidatus Taylorbacteria bacterium RIFCSPLOWO2_01_FULL_45_15b]|uniref:Cell division protein FtsA n=1 Tax=Candidatus Taylorbacteria bacterium RIFCSPLOWO2_01_FULL_45_15b TaxID=1802319 RepID=A0A1G2NDE5_9BACT|nr:MAG: cell division protein FtsA [Candidatus Taylorbacteria bacterium RIFCSPLOWO2_01_FULL_45_15b]